MAMGLGVCKRGNETNKHPSQQPTRQWNHLRTSGIAGRLSWRDHADDGFGWTGTGPGSPAPSRQWPLAVHRPPYRTRGVGGLHVVGYHPACVHVHGRRGPALLGRQTHRPRREFQQAVSPRALAGIDSSTVSGVSHLGLEQTDRMGLYQRARADRSGLPYRLPAGLHETSHAMAGRLRDTPGLLAGVRAISAPGGGIRLAERRSVPRIGIT